MIHLDSNASAAVLPQALEAYLSALDVQDIDALLAVARCDVAGVLRISDAWVGFTSGGTEANALIVKHALRHGGVAIISIYEHPSVAANARKWASRVYEIQDDNDLNAIEDDVALVSCCFASSETGIILPIQAIMEKARRRWPSAVLHTDAVQAVGRVPVDMSALGVDIISCTGHKLGAVPGTGVLAGPLCVCLRDAGCFAAETMNVPGIVSLAAAMKVLPNDAQIERWKAQRLRVESVVRELGGSVVGEHLLRLPQTVCAHFSGCLGEAMLQLLDLDGIAVSAGTACSSGSIEASSTLIALGMTSDAALETLRISLSRGVLDEEVDQALDALCDAHKRFTHYY